jgi:PAS domain S-box-containing protein
MNSGTGTKSSHILILEDDTTHQEFSLRAFRDDPDRFRVSVAGTVREARQVIQRDPPDLIIADWLLPDGKGLDILPRRDGMVTVPLIIMTSFGDEQLAVEIMKSGAIDYIVKSAMVFRELPHIARKALRDWENIRERKRVEAAMLDTQKRLADILSFLPDAVFAIDTAGRVIAWNNAMERMTGVPASEMLGKGDHEYSLPFYNVRRPILIDLVLMTDAEMEKKYDYIQRDDGRITSETFIPTLCGGKGAYLWGTASSLYDTAGNCVGAIEVIRDITERKHAEESVQEQKVILETLLNAPSDTIALLDRQGTIIDINEAAARRLGGTVQSMAGRCAYGILPADVAAVRKAHNDRVFETGKPDQFDDAWSGMYFHNEIFPIFNPEHTGVDHIAIFARDITDQKQAEQALCESEERLRLALEGADIASWDWDLLSGNTVFSDRFYTMLGYKPGEFPSTYDGWAALIHPDDHDRVLPDLKRQIEEKRPLCEIEYRLLSKDGHWFWILGRGKIAGTDDKGNPTRVTGVNIDITNRRLMESEIRSLNTVLEQRVKDRTEALAKTNKALEEEVAQRQEAEQRLKGSYDEKVMLLKEIHHRVKNNLQIIVSLLNLQSRYITDEKTLAAIRESQNRVKAMAIVHEKLYRAEDISHISLHDYIRFLGTGLFQFYDAKSRGIQFTLEIHDVNVDIDAAIPIGLIMNELISNSLKYAFPEGRKGEVAIDVKKEGHILTVVYRDTGIGIPADLDWRNTQSLGLRLVNTLVDQMSGTVELDSSSGTLFTMVLHEKEQRDPS